MMEDVSQVLEHSVGAILTQLLHALLSGILNVCQDFLQVLLALWM